jgi:hypothetical protein
MVEEIYGTQKSPLAMHAYLVVLTILNLNDKHEEAIKGLRGLIHLDKL